jgi:hypothetical protein
MKLDIGTGNEFLERQRELKEEMAAKATEVNERKRESERKIVDTNNYEKIADNNIQHFKNVNDFVRNSHRANFVACVLLRVYISVFVCVCVRAYVCSRNMLLMIHLYRSLQFPFSLYLFLSLFKECTIRPCCGLFGSCTQRT